MSVAVRSLPLGAIGVACNYKSWLSTLGYLLSRFERRCADGYHIAVGGTVEESNKAQVSVAAVLPLMLVLTLTVLMIQLQRFSRLFLVLSVAPLGLIGVVAALLLSDKPLGFVALLGVLALTGMIARNSVILIADPYHRQYHPTRLSLFSNRKSV